jgi:hypothetical protein
MKEKDLKKQFTIYWDEYKRIKMNKDIVTGWSFENVPTSWWTFPEPKKNINFVPTKIIFNNRTTICFFEDGSKVISKCMDGQEFDAESGVAVCIAKKVVGDHSKLRKLVDKAYHQPDKKSEDYFYNTGDEGWR